MKELASNLPSLLPQTATLGVQRRARQLCTFLLDAGLQGWLSEVKGWEGSTPAPSSTIDVTVEEVRPGRRMYLVQGSTDISESKKFLLAGEGRLTGLGQRMPLSVGSVVKVGQPVWDIELDGEVWTVACDWGPA